MEYHQYNSPNQQSSDHTIFVGCLDPRTLKEDVVSYFKLFDRKVKAKLIVNFKTGQSKQCALLFCSSQEACQEILKHDHYLHERRLRLDYAQDEFKGKKTDQMVPIQISGLDPETTIEGLLEYFEQVPGFKKARLVKGLHPKQKKVAVLYFADSDSAQEVLNQYHLKIGKRNCKVAEYVKDKAGIHQSVNFEAYTKYPQKPIAMSYNPQGQDNWESNSPQSYSSGFQSMTSNTSPSFKGGVSPGTEAPRRIEPLKLNQGFHLLPAEPQKPRQEDTFVHPVEVQEDDLFRIFCDSEKGKELKTTLLPPTSGKKITESNETAPE